MRFWISLAGAIAALALATAAGAATTSYDGSYAGTSATYTGTTGGGKGNSCTPFPAPPPLSISNGHAVTTWTGAPMEGDISPDGKLVMHSNLNGRFEGQIDGTGLLKGAYAGYCIYNLTWQRRR